MVTSGVAVCLLVRLLDLPIITEGKEIKGAQQETQVPTVADKKYYVEYNDCTVPSDLLHYSASDVCETDAEVQEKETKEGGFAILQSRTVEETSGYSCEVTLTSVLSLCGVWGHLKLVQMPRIAHPLMLTKDTCHQIIMTKSWTPPGSTKAYKLSFNQYEYIEEITVGTLNLGSNGKLACTGEQRKVSVHGVEIVAEDVIQMSEYRVVIKREKFLVSPENRVETSTEHTELPCDHLSGGCVTADRTYVWDRQSVPKCPLQKVKEVRATEHGTWIKSKEDQIFLNRTVYKLVPGCIELGPVSATNYDRLFVYRLPLPKQLELVNAETVDIEADMRLQLAFLVEELQAQTANTALTIRKNKCLDLVNFSKDTPTLLPDGRFARLTGEDVLVFSCQKKQAVIVPNRRCYRDIPIAIGFVTPLTRLLVPHSAEIPCDNKLPPVVKTTEGLFVSVTNQVQPRAELFNSFLQPTGEEDDHKIHVNSVSLYTAAEIEAWRNLLSFPAYSEAVMKSVTMGQCVNEGHCTQREDDLPLPRYNLEGIRDELADSVDVFSGIRKWIRRQGDLLAFIVICIYVGKLMIHLGLLAATVLQHGIAAGISLIIRLYISSWYSYGRVREQARREDVKRKKTSAASRRQGEEEVNIPLRRLAEISEIEPEDVPVQSNLRSLTTETYVAASTASEENRRLIPIVSLNRQ